MSGQVPTLLDAFSLVEDFRQARGKRYKLPAILLLTWLAMLHGKKSELEIAEWSGGEGRRWLPLLGVRRHRGPSYATIHRILRGIDRRQLEAALMEWTEQARQAMKEMEVSEESEEGDSRIAEKWLSEACQVLAQSLATVAIGRGADVARLEGLAVTGAIEGGNSLPVEASTISSAAHPSEAGLKFWGLDWDRIEEDRPAILPVAQPVVPPVFLLHQAEPAEATPVRAAA